MCERLANRGWKELFLRHGLDITSSNLKEEFLKELPGIDRSINGFEDFALEGIRGIEPGQPARSLFYHALASPNVVEGLTDFPTWSELESVENYVYGINPPSLSDIRLREQDSSLALVVFASEYRPASDTVHKKHADVCFSRTGVARVGTEKPNYIGEIRGFLPFVKGQPNAFRVLPAKYSVYIAAKLKGNRDQFGPMRFQEGDHERSFWVPIHKIFSGTECIRDYDLSVSFKAHHVNEKLKRIHLKLGKSTGWSEPVINKKPFSFTDGIAEISSDSQFGTGVLMPIDHLAMVEVAEYNGEILTFRVPKDNNHLSTSLAIEPVNGARRAPEYVHVRHTLDQNGSIKDLNDEPDLAEIVKNGDYQAVHYIDYTADGWVEAECPELAFRFPGGIHSAYSIVTAPDFFPSCDQRELMDWWEQVVPDSIKADIWRVEPTTLSDDRLAVNIHLMNGEKAEFNIDDKTMTAVISLPYIKPSSSTEIKRTKAEIRHSFLPDAASGEFAPGWDVSRDSDESGTEFLASYGLGSPFPEDAKLCAALSTYWPAVAPDAARTFEPSHRWPTVSPLTDEEIGQIGTFPWDGVNGPKEIPGKNMVEYNAFDYTDYVDLAKKNKFTLALTSRVDVVEYTERIFTMAYVYRALGIQANEKGDWSVLSFRKIESVDEELQTAQDDTGFTLSGTIYRFVIYRHGNISRGSNNDFKKSLVEIREKATLFTNGIYVLLKREDDKWAADKVTI